VHTARALLVFFSEKMCAAWPSRDTRLFSHYQHAEKTDKVPTYFATDERTQPARIVTTEKTNILLRQFHVQAETQVQPTRRSPRPMRAPRRALFWQNSARSLFALWRRDNVRSARHPNRWSKRRASSHGVQ